MAFVALGDPGTTPYKGRTNMLGQITFSGPDIVGPQRVTAWATNYEVGTFDCVDSQDVSIWLRSPIPPPGDPVGSVGPQRLDDQGPGHVRRRGRPRLAVLEPGARAAHAHRAQADLHHHQPRRR
jgi:hypothetical protein